MYLSFVWTQSAWRNTFERAALCLDSLVSVGYSLALDEGFSLNFFFSCTYFNRTACRTNAVYNKQNGSTPTPTTNMNMMQTSLKKSLLLAEWCKSALASERSRMPCRACRVHYCSGTSPSQPTISAQTNTTCRIPSTVAVAQRHNVQLLI